MLKGKTKDWIKMKLTSLGWYEELMLEINL
jgi:hypothetical protein